jgi:hypothetical protein
MSALLRYFPVPTRSRDRKLWPPMLSDESEAVVGRVEDMRKR